MRRSPVRVGAVTLAAVLGTAVVSPPPATGSFPGRNGRIAYVDGERGDIFSMSADGTDRRRLTRNGRSSRPAWSPDGRRVLYVRASPEDRSEPTTWSVWVMRARGTNHRRLTEGSDAAWAPNGRKLVTTRDDNLFVYTFKTRAVEEIPLPEPVTAASDPAWSPDGRRIAFVGAHAGSDGTPRQDLFTVKPDGTGLRQITTTTHVTETEPSWAPGGKRIVVGRFSREADPQPVGLAVVPASGPRRVAETGELPEEYGGRWFQASGDTHPSWSPNGARIVAGPTWNRRGNGLWVGRTDGTRVRRIGGGLMWQPDWQPLP